MNYDLTYTLRKAIETELPGISKAQIIYDGADLKKLQKPFVTIQPDPSSTELMAAGRTSYFDSYSWQVGIHASTPDELYRLESALREVIREPYGHPLYFYNDVTDAFELTGKLIPFDDLGFTPIFSDDNSAETEHHRGYFIVGADVY